MGEKDHNYFSRLVGESFFYSSGGNRLRATYKRKKISPLNRTAWRGFIFEGLFLFYYTKDSKGHAQMSISPLQAKRNKRTKENSHFQPDSIFFFFLTWLLVCPHYWKEREGNFVPLFSGDLARIQKTNSQGCRI